MPHVIFIEEDGAEKKAPAELGQTILEVARANDVNIEGACGGNMACATCHLIVEDNWFQILPRLSVDETDMLELAYGLTPTSRLGCQITVTEELDGLILSVPSNSKSI